LPTLDHVLTLLQDGAWHPLPTLATQVHLPSERLASLARLLAATHLIDYDAGKNRVRLTPEWQTMLHNTDEASKPRKDAVGTMILPPKQAIRIQGITITNLTDRDLELDLRVDDTLNEIAINTVA
jgi:hypothetical protein